MYEYIILYIFVKLYTHVFKIEHLVHIALNQSWFHVIPNGHDQGALEASKILAKMVASTRTAGPKKPTVLEMEEIGYTLGVAPFQ